MEGFLAVEEDIEHLAACTYIRQILSHSAFASISSHIQLHSVVAVQAPQNANNWWRGEQIRMVVES